MQTELAIAPEVPATGPLGEIKIGPPDHGGERSIHLGDAYAGFLGKQNSLYLVRCPACKRENYAMNVSLGVCTWCPFDGNDYLHTYHPSVLEMNDDQRS